MYIKVGVSLTGSVPADNCNENMDNNQPIKNKQRMPSTKKKMNPTFGNGVSESITANYMGKRINTTHVSLHILPGTTIE